LRLWLQSQPSICSAFGIYTKDKILSPPGVKYVDGGAVNHAAHAVVRLVHRVTMVTPPTQEDHRRIKKFRQDSINCHFFYTPHSNSMKLEFLTGNPDTRSFSVASVAEPILASELNDIRTKSAIIGTSFRGEVSKYVIFARREKKSSSGQTCKFLCVC
jgi:hypothetical protein